VAAVLGWKELPGVDATDALAIALTHLNAARLGR
jgi:Holliday junction resolvasome RuvABC endonuclease subunit